MAGNDPSADDSESAGDTWWAPAVAATPGSRLPSTAVGAWGEPTDRLRSAGIWKVVDTGTSVRVSGTSAQSVGLGLRSIGGLAVIGAFVVLSGSGDPVPVLIFVAVAIALAATMRRSGVRTPFIGADATGLQLRTALLSRRTMTIPWDDVAGLESRSSVATWPRTEGWFVVTNGGERLRVPAWSGRQGWNPYPDLRRIMVGIGLFPLRLGRPALPIDGVPGPNPPYVEPPPRA